MTRPRLILLIRCAVLAVALWLGAEALLLFVPVALMMPPSLLGPPPATCAIASDDFSTDRLATDYTTLAGTFAVSGGECSTSSGTARIVNNATSTTGSGKASVDAKSSNTGNTARVIGAYDGSAYAYAELTFNGSSSTWKVFSSSGTQIGITRTTSTSTTTYYTLTICWDGTSINAILSDNSGVCKGTIHGAYTSSSGNQAGFGATVAAGSVTFDNFSFGHGGGDTIGGVDCDDCSSAIDMTSSECSCQKCDPAWHDELDVDISGITALGCASCSGLNGLFRLTKIYDGGACDGSTFCCWKVSFSGGCCGPNTVEALLSHSGGTYTLSIQITFTAGGAGCPGGTSTSPLNWSQSYVGKPDCSAWVAEAIATFGGNPIGARCDGSAATVTVTAVVI